MKSELRAIDHRQLSETDEPLPEETICFTLVKRVLGVERLDILTNMRS